MNPLAIGVIGTTGHAGTLIAAESASRGHRVTAIVRDSSRLTVPVAAVIETDVLALTTIDVTGLDVLVSAFGVPVSRAPEHLLVTRHLIDLLSGTGVRLIVVGSAGHLFSHEDRSDRYWQTQLPDGPLRDDARTLERAYALLQDGSDLRWTYMAPPIEFVKDAPRTGRYRIGTDVVLADEHGRSTLSYADYATALVDEIESGAHPQQMFTVAA